MQKKTAIITSVFAALLFVFAAAGSASALSLEIDIPEYAVPGETVTGSVWIMDAGNVDKNLTSYQLHLLADSSLGIAIDSSDVLNMGFVTYYPTIPYYIAGGYTGGGLYYSINPSAQKLCNFTITVPLTAAIGTTYAVNITKGSPTTYLMSYTTYYCDGSSQSTSHGTIPGAVLSTVNATVTVTDPGTYHTVTFYNETSTVYNTTTVLDGNKVTRPVDPSKTGHAFMGWNNTSASGPAYDFDAPVTTDLSLYANWSANSYTVTFYNETGTVYTTSSVTYGSTVAAPADPVKTGYTFNGWNRSSPSGPAYVFSTPVTADLSLYANWSVNSYAITYINPSHGTVSGALSAAYGSTVPVTASPASGYQFSQLVVTKAGSSTTVSTSGKTFVMPAYDVNVTAVFTVAPTPVPTSGPSGGGGGSQWSQILPGPSEILPGANVTEVPTVIPTIRPTTKPVTSKSPAPVAGLVAGLGVAAVLLRFRK